MSLSPEQTAEVAQWVRDGATLSDVQKRIDTDFKISMTYMDVRFLVDDLDLTLVDPAPKAPAADGTVAEKDATVDDEGAVPAIGGVTVEADAAVLIPGAIASGSVTFSDGVTAKWMVDHQGRPGFTEVSQDGYRPTPEDGEAFMQELSAALRAKGMG